MPVPDNWRPPSSVGPDSLADLVTAIHDVNRLWKLAQRGFGPETDSHQEHDPLSESLRDMKDHLQLQLLQDYPEAVTLEWATDIAGRAEYALQLRGSGGDAAHCPVDRIERWKRFLPAWIVAQHDEEMKQHAR